MSVMAKRPCRITYHVGAFRTFDRLFNESTLEDMKDVIRSKLKLPSDAAMTLVQVREGMNIDLEDDEDFESFAILASNSLTIDVRVALLNATHRTIASRRSLPGPSVNVEARQASRQVVEPWLKSSIVEHLEPVRPTSVAPSTVVVSAGPDATAGTSTAVDELNVSTTRNKRPTSPSADAPSKRRKLKKDAVAVHPNSSPRRYVPPPNVTEKDHPIHTYDEIVQQRPGQESITNLSTAGAEDAPMVIDERPLSNNSRNLKALLDQEKQREPTSAPEEESARTERETSIVLKSAERMNKGGNSGRAQSIGSGEEELEDDGESATIRRSKRLFIKKRLRESVISDGADDEQGVADETPASKAKKSTNVKGKEKESEPVPPAPVVERSVVEGDGEIIKTKRPRGRPPKVKAPGPPQPLAVEEEPVATAHDDLRAPAKPTETALVEKQSELTEPVAAGTAGKKKKKTKGVASTTKDIETSRPVPADSGQAVGAEGEAGQKKRKKQSNKDDKVSEDAQPIAEHLNSADGVPPELRPKKKKKAKVNDPESSAAADVAQDPSAVDISIVESDHTLKTRETKKGKSPSERQHSPETRKNREPEKDPSGAPAAKAGNSETITVTAAVQDEQLQGGTTNQPAEEAVSEYWRLLRTSSTPPSEDAPKEPPVRVKPAKAPPVRKSRKVPTPQPVEPPAPRRRPLPESLTSLFDSSPEPSVRHASPPPIRAAPVSVRPPSPIIAKVPSAKVPSAKASSAKPPSTKLPSVKPLSERQTSPPRMNAPPEREKTPSAKAPSVLHTSPPKVKAPDVTPTSSVAAKAPSEQHVSSPRADTPSERQPSPPQMLEDHVLDSASHVEENVETTTSPGSEEEEPTSEEPKKPASSDEDNVASVTAGKSEDEESTSEESEKDEDDEDNTDNDDGDAVDEMMGETSERAGEKDDHSGLHALGDAALLMSSNRRPKGFISTPIAQSTPLFRPNTQPMSQLSDFDYHEPVPSYPSLSSLTREAVSMSQRSRSYRTSSRSTPQPKQPALEDTESDNSDESDEEDSSGKEETVSILPRSKMAGAGMVKAKKAAAKFF